MSLNETGIIIQARTGSKRLPGKVILPFYKEQSLIDILLKNAQVLAPKYNIIIATSDKSNDDIIAEYAMKYGYKIFRGDENNVLKRFIGAAKKYQLETIIRICSDNPFLDMSYVEQLIDIFNKKENLDYCSFKVYDGTPVIKTHLGLFAEVVTLKGLERAYRECNLKIYREHVTNYLYSNPNKFNFFLEKAPKEVFKRSDLRFTLDDLEDFNNLSFVYRFYVQSGENIVKTIEFIDNNRKVKEKMINNIKKYNK